MNFSAVLLSASNEMLKCGLKLEKLLERVLNLAEKCSPEVAMVTATSLTKLVSDVSAAPLFVAEKTRLGGKELLHAVMTLAAVLNEARPYEVRTEKDLQRALDVTKAACVANALVPEASVLMALLVKEIARVFLELRVVLKRRQDRASKRLLGGVKHFMRAARRYILCFSYNSTKLVVCMRGARECGQGTDKPVARALLRDLYKLQNNARAMAAVSPLHRTAVQRTLEMAKSSVA